MKKTLNNLFILILLFLFVVPLTAETITNEQILLLEVKSAKSNKKKIKANKNLLHYYLNAKEYDKIIPVCDKLLEMKLSKKQKYLIYYNMSIIYNHNKDFENAIEHCKEAEFLCPEKIDPKILLGKIYKENALYELALDKFKETLHIDDESVTALINIGEIYKIQENYKASLSYYEQAVDIRKNVDAGVYINMAISAKELGLSGKAEEILEDLYNQNPTKQVSLLLADIYKEQGRFKDAQKKLSLLLNKENATDIEVYTNLAALYILSKEFDKAKKLLLYFKSKNNNIETVDLLLAVTYYGLSDKETAVNLINNVIEYTKSNYIKFHSKHLLKLFKADLI